MVHWQSTVISETLQGFLTQLTFELVLYGVSFYCVHNARTHRTKAGFHTCLIAFFVYFSREYYVEA
jgi:hypothetical protein